MNNDISKRLLCNNILKYNKCNYGRKCMYAHVLNEQKIDHVRKYIYYILTSTQDLIDIDLILEKELFENFLQLTKICMNCTKQICSGGYNCRNGALSIHYKICYEDFMFGKCNKLKCNSVHLTFRGLIPYNIQKKSKNPNQFFKNYFRSSSTKSDSDSCDNDDVESIIKYLHSDNNIDTSLTRSIFE